MKKIFVTIILAVVAVTTRAYDAKIDNIYYNLNNTEKTAEVTYKISSGRSYSESITIPESIVYNGETYSVTGITSYAFKRCTGLTSITIPNSVTRIGGNAFEDTPWYSEYSTKDENIYGNIIYINEVAYHATSTSITSCEFKKNTVSISDYAFRECTGLTSVTIPHSVTSIGSEAFEGCTGLTSVTIGNSVKSIGYYAFNGCTSLMSVNITDISAWCNISFDSYANPLIYAHHLYLNGVEIKELVIPDSVTSIGSNAFEGCTGLTAVTIPHSVKSIEYYAFGGCTGLTSVTIPNSVTSIGSESFKGCTGLTSVTIPNSVKSIEYYAFNGCTSLTSVNITDISAWCNISFGSYANPLIYAQHLYLNGVEIKELVIPDSVTSIGSEAFEGCTGLTSVTIPNSVKSIGYYAFNECTSLMSVNITDISAWCNISFGSYANPLIYAQHLYLNGVEIKELVIPDSVTSIGSNAFEGCTSLTSVTIPHSVTSIGSKAFANCDKLESVTCYAVKIPEMNSSVFKDCNVANALLEVPAASVDLYKKARQWRDFGTIQSIPETECATPVITFADGKIVVTCETEGATCHYNWKISSLSGKGTDSIVLTGINLIVTAYATVMEYYNSETVTTTITLSPKGVGDVNRDGVIDIADVNAVLTKMFSK